MKKLLLLVFAAWLLGAQAADVSAVQAQAVAAQFLQSGAQRAPGATGAALTLAYEAKAATGQADYSGFNLGGDGGYVVVAGNDGALPVLGYSNSGTFDYDQLPPNAQWWLGEYQREMEWLRSHPGSQARQPRRLATSVAPLLSTTWDQGKPFNNNCPTYSSWWGSQRCATGCVATATAQIMKYHSWPATGKGSHSYTCDVEGGSTQTLSANFSQSNYQWSQMRNSYSSSYTSSQANAVAKLMSDVGIAEEMNYGPESGTSSYMAYHALRTYFDYDASSIHYELRDFYELDVWEQMLREELDAHRPVYYAGSGTSGGHAFVFDGYDSMGYFHVNWGWSGSSDNYYAVTALDPPSLGTGGGAGGFNSNQDAILGIQPNTTGVDAPAEPLRGLMAKMTTTTVSTRIGTQVNFELGGIVFMGDNSWSNLAWGFVLTDSTDTQTLATNWFTNANDLTLGVMYGISSVAYTVPNNLMPGVYHLHAVYRIDGVTHFFERPASSRCVPFTVVDGIAYFSGEVPESRARLTLVSDIIPTDERMPADNVQAIATVQAEEVDWNGVLTAVILDRDGDSYTTLATMPTSINVGANKQAHVTFYGSFDGIDGHTYYLALFDPASNTGAVWGDYAPFVVEQLTAAMITPTDGTLVNFGATTQSSTNIQSLSLRGENLTGSLTLTLGGSGASHYKLSASSVSTSAATRGTTVNITYRPTAKGRHDATLTISGGGLTQPVTVTLTGHVPTSTTAADGNLTAPDMAVTPADTSRVLDIPVKMELPAGATFTDVQLVVTLPQGLRPCADSEGSYGHVGTDAGALTFAHNLATVNRWPTYTITGGSSAHTAITANPCQVFTLHVTADTAFTEGTRDIVAYASYTTPANAAFTLGTAAAPLTVAHVTFGEPTNELPGDLNGDGSIDIGDVNILINIILDLDQAENYGRRAYVTDDDAIDIADVNALINIILTQ